MKPFFSTLVLLTSAFLSGCATQTAFNTIGDPAGEERRLLVTFADRSITRVVNGNTQDAYQLHGNYGNSGWSERQAQMLAKQYQIDFIAQWPVTELGVSCVVFEVPKSLSTAEVIESLKKDAHIQLVQPMHYYLREILYDTQS